jgi:uncharacterized DUF497 family protein
MVKPMDRLRECTGFEWDDGNATKNWRKHDVSQSECEQVFFNRPLILRRDGKHSDLEPRYYVLGSTDIGRLLFMVFTIRGERIRVISARNMTELEEQRFQG